MNKVFLGIPTTGRMRYELTMWILRNYGKLDTIHFSVDGFKDTNANKIIHAFLKGECTHLLLMDDDILPDDNLITRLLSHDKDVIAGCPIIFNIHEKRFKISAYKKRPRGKFTQLGLTGKVEKVDVIGGACVLIKREVLEKLKAPWFKMVMNNDGVNRTGADTYFSNKCRENGIDIYADCSTPLGHKNYQDVLDLLIASMKGRKRRNN